jgi:ankyrin repeat protein
MLRATPLYIAAQNGHKEVVEYLCDRGAEVEALFKYVLQTYRDLQIPSQCYKPIYIANARGHKAVVDTLTSKGANLSGLNPIPREARANN